MKRFFAFIFGLALLLNFTSCDDPNLPFEAFDELEKGAVARLLAPSTFSAAGDFTKSNVAGSKLAFEVDFYDGDKGKNVESFNFLVQFTDRKTGGANNVAQKPLVSYTSSQFTTHPTFGTQTLKVEITFQQVMTALGLTIDKVNVGDRFTFNATIKTKDGRTFTVVNTSSEFVNSPAFGFPMEFRRDVK